MDTGHFKVKLLEKQRELLVEIGRLEAAAREARDTEVEDPIDSVTSSEGRAEAFRESSLEWQTLTQVRDALTRIDENRYGSCLECGRRIEPARLEAVPWTPYCLEDQEKLDRREDRAAAE